MKDRPSAFCAKKKNQILHLTESSVTFLNFEQLRISLDSTLLYDCLIEGLLLLLGYDNVYY